MDTSAPVLLSAAPSELIRICIITQGFAPLHPVLSPYGALPLQYQVVAANFGLRASDFQLILSEQDLYDYCDEHDGFLHFLPQWALRYSQGTQRLILSGVTRQRTRRHHVIQSILLASFRGRSPKNLWVPPYKFYSAVPVMRLFAPFHFALRDEC